jgi:hypothetical protein
MSIYTTYNKKLAVKQLTITGPTSKRSGSFAVIQQNSEMAVTELLLDADMGDIFFIKGSKVVFHGVSCMKDWNKQVFSNGSTEFVLAPFEDVVMISPPAEEVKDG